MSEHPTSTRKGRVLVLSWLAYASYYLGRKGFSVTKAAIAAELALSASALAVIDSALLAAYAVGQVPSGMLGDRIGARRLIVLGLLGSALACAAFGLAHGAVALALCFGLNGLMQSTGWPGTTKAVADVTASAERGRVMGWWSTCYQVGGIAATAAATFLLAHSGWRAAFFGPALWMALLAVVLWFALEGQVAERPAQADRANGGAGSAAAPKPVAFRLLIANPTLLSYGACYFCLKLIRYSLLFWLPYYLHKAAGFDQITSGYLSVAFEIGGVAGTIALGYLSDRSARGRAGTSLFSLAGLALALLLYARLPAGAAALHFGAMAAIGALLFGPDALLAGAAAQDAGGPASAATAVGIVNGMGSWGGLLQGALTVWVERTWGWHALFYVFVGLSLLACVCLLPAAREGRRSDARTAAKPTASRRSAE